MKQVVLFVSLFFCGATSLVLAQESPTTGRVNLGTAVNSVHPEVKPVISADDRVLYFVVEGHPQNRGIKYDPESQDVWYSERDAQGAWLPAQRASESINLDVLNSLFWISPKGNEILIRGRFDATGKRLGRGISRCVKQDTGWSKPITLQIKRYEEMSLGIYAGASLSTDGRTLLLYLSEEKGSVNSDIYVSFLQTDGSWSQPMSVGETINQESTDEISPFLASDGKTMYFASNREGGLGKHDIWMTRRLDESWTKWATPVNLGPQVNSSGWDGFLSLNQAGTMAYFASGLKPTEGSDIFSAKLDSAFQPLPIAVVSGKLQGANPKIPLAGSYMVKRIGDGQSNDVQKGTTNGKDGSYRINFPTPGNYEISMSAKGFVSATDTVMIAATDQGVVRRDVYLTSELEEAQKNTCLRERDSLVQALAAKDKLLEIARTQVMDEELEASKFDKVAAPATRKKKANRNNATGAKPRPEVAVAEEEMPEEAMDGIPESTEGNVLYFQFGKSWIQQRDYAKAERMASQLLANSGSRAIIRGYTDAVGSSGRNLKLSADRAQAIRQYLLFRGIDANRISIQFYGESQPASSNATDSGRAANRRAVVVIKSASEQ